MNHNVNGENDEEKNLPSSEQTPLLSTSLPAAPSGGSFLNGDASGNPSSGNNSVANSNPESVSSIEAEIEAEVDDPWPASFGRSISLLAMSGPHSGQLKDVDRMTRSPLRSITPRMALTRRNKKEFVMTPEFSRPLVKRHSAAADPHKPGAQSLQAQLTAEDPHAYRKKLLKQQVSTGIVTKADLKKRQQQHQKDARHEDEPSAQFSPGMMKEKETDRLAKKQAQAAEAQKVDGKSSVAQCIFNMANILMGVGMLGLPFVCKSAGYIGGITIVIIFAAVTHKTSIIIGRLLNGDPRPSDTFDQSPYKSPIPPGSTHVKARMRKPIQTFPEIARDAFGDAGTIVLSVVLYFELFSCLAIFFVSLGEHMHELFPQVSAAEHEVVLAVALALPTVLLNTPRLLSYLSAVGTFATVAVVSAVVLSACMMGDISEEMLEARVVVESDSPTTSNGEEVSHHALWHTSGLPVALGLVAYCFSGHAIVPSIYTSMKEPQKYERMVDGTFLIVLTCCLVVALSGYYMFGTSVDDQVTISLAEVPGVDGGFAISILTWLMVLTAFSKFTLTMFPLALGMEEIAAPFLPTDVTAVQTLASYLIRLGLIVLALLVALYVPSFSFLCALVGLVCTMVVSVIFPAAAHLKLFGERLSWWEKLVDYVFIVFGLISAVVGTIATVA